MRNRRKDHPEGSMLRRWDIDAEEGFGFEVTKDVDEGQSEESEVSE